MKHVIVGTAGHIDHGKTALVKALTGIDADRLAEEKRRGITIDIGFAHLDVPPDLRIGFVDVPGHERFVKNMLAGAAGIDLVMLVIAAGESIKPQTREHFAICRLLGIRTGLIALTKSDLVDNDLLELTRMDIEEFVAGSFLEGATIVPVSSKTGAGVDELRAALAQAARQSSVKNASGAFRLPIDRAFTMRGFGTVVTGTLISGEVHPEQDVMLYPKRTALRVRGVQVHGTAAAKAVAGQRTAINLAGIEAREIARGMLLAAPERFVCAKEFGCALETLEDAPPVRNRTPVHLHVGTAELEAEIRLFPGEPELAPGGRTYARIVLREPALLVPRDRFIIRRFSPVSTIGGGVILDVGRSRTRERLERIDHATTAEWVAILVQESSAGMSPSELAKRTGLGEREIPDHFGILKLPGWYVDRKWLEAARETLIAQIREFHRLNPLAPGMPKKTLASTLPGPVIDVLLKHPELAVEGDVVRHRTHRIVLQQQEESARNAIVSAFETAGLAVPALSEVLAASGVEAGKARTLLQILLREGTLVRVSDELVFHKSALGGLRASLTKGSKFTVPEFKQKTGVSRKYAIPLLEYLDREKITRREGDSRVVL